MNGNVLGGVLQILEGYKHDHCDLPEAVRLLTSIFQKVPVGEQHQFFDVFQSQIFSEPLPSPQLSRTVHAPIIRAWATFGPADWLPGLVFALLRYDGDNAAQESWALGVAAEFVYSLYANRDRFSSVALNVISAQCGICTYPEKSVALTGVRFPSSVVEATTRLSQTADKIRFERFTEPLRTPQFSLSAEDGPKSSRPSISKSRSYGSSLRAVPDPSTSTTFWGARLQRESWKWRWARL